MDIAQIIQIIHSIKQDKALDREEWLIVLPMVKNLLAQVESQVEHKWILIVALKGCQTIIDEIIEHIEEMEHGS